VLPGHSGGALVCSCNESRQQYVVGMLVQHTVVSDGEGGSSFLPHFNCRLVFAVFVRQVPLTTNSQFITSVPSQLLQLVLHKLKSGETPSAAMRVLSSVFALHRCLPFAPTAPHSYRRASRVSDLGAVWNMKSFARHRLLQEPVALVNQVSGAPMSKL
jgi:hypothetical protein